MRLGRLGKQLQPISTTINQDLTCGQLSRREAFHLKQELVSLLISPDTRLSRLPDFCSAHRGLKGQFRRMADEYGVEYKLPQALYASYVKGCPPRVSLERYRGVQLSDWNLVHAYADELGRDVGGELTALSLRRGGAPNWTVRTEADFEEVDVHVEPAAMEAMILSVYETYKVPRSNRGPGFTETYGVCFGTKSVHQLVRRGQGLTQLVTIHLQRAVPQLRARMTADSVLPEMRSTGIFLEVGKHLFRHCEIVGEFHSHPYENLTQLKRAGGWNNSREDQVYVHSQLGAWRKLRQSPRVFLICAVARGKSTPTDKVAAGRNNIFALHFSACRFYLAAYRILPNGDLADDGVTIQCCGSLNGHRM